MALKFPLLFLFALSLRAFAALPAIIDDGAGFFSRETQIVARELLTDLSTQIQRSVFVKTAPQFAAAYDAKADLSLSHELSNYPPSAIILLVSGSPSFVTVLDKTGALTEAQRSRLIRPFVESFPYLQRDRALMGFITALRSELGVSRISPFSTTENIAWSIAAILLLAIIFMAAEWRVSIWKYLSIGAFALAAWMVANGTVLFSLGNVFIRDNMSHLNIFSYIVDYWRKFGTPPPWTITKQGGVWLEVLANNHLLLAPYKFPFYLMAVYAGMPTTLAYKLSILVGILGLLGGIYFVLRVFCKNPYLPLLGTATALFSGIGVGVLHQEQTLGTMFFIPWIWYLLLKPSRLSVFGACFLAGFALNVHYPQLHFGYHLVLLLAFACTPTLGAQAIRTIKRLIPNRKTFAWASLFILLGASPILFSYAKYFDKLSSPFRGQTDTITERNFESYSKMRGIQQSSLPPQALLNYLLPSNTFVASMGLFDDKNVFCIGALGVFLILAFLLRLPHLPFHLVVIGGLLFLSTGVYSFAARLGWFLIPGTSLFRQWYHFTSLANLHLLVFAVLTVDWALLRAESLLQTRQFHVAVRVGLLSLLLIPNFLWSFHTMTEYRDAAIGSRTYAPLDWNSPKFLTDLFYEGKLPFSGTFAAIQAVKPNLVPSLYRPGMLSWKMGAELIPVKPDAVKVTQEGKSISLEPVQIPKGAEALVVIQADDAQWNIWNELKTKIPPSGRGLLVLPLSAGKRFIFSHSFSAWYFLVASIALILLIFTILYLPKGFREGH